MSLKTWKEEFYIIPAGAAGRKTKLEAIEHSLQKWMGTTPANLKKHGVIYEDHEVREPFFRGRMFYEVPSFEFTANSCSLCEKYAVVNWMEPTDCTKCPLSERNGRKDCIREYRESDYKPDSMIKLLEGAFVDELKKLEGL